MWSRPSPVRNSQLSGRSGLLSIVSIPSDECYVRTWRLGISGVGIPPPEERVFQAEETAGAEPGTSESIMLGAPQRDFCVCLLGGRQGSVCGQPMNKSMGLDFLLG